MRATLATRYSQKTFTQKLKFSKEKLVQPMGPLTFIVYDNHICDVIDEHCTFVQHTDETTLLYLFPTAVCSQLTHSMKKSSRILCHIFDLNTEI